MRRRRSWLARRGLLAGGGAVVAASAGCVGYGLLAEPQPIDVAARSDNMPNQGGWDTPLPNPVLPAGSLHPRALWNDPMLMIEGGRYVMWLTTSIRTPFRPPIVPFRAVSDDRGRTWRLDPQGPVAMPDGTRFVNVETPSVVRFRGRYHMYFSGIYPDARPALMAVGHAVSDDGVSWRVDRDPVISETGRASDWNGVLVGEPGAIVRGDEIFVYFSAVGARASGNPPQDQTIGLARTRDGTSFGPPQRVLAQAAAYPPERGFCGYSTPYPFELDGRVHLMMDVALNDRAANPEWQQVALHHAVSTTDGVGGWVQDERPIFTRNDFPHTLGGIIGPAVLIDEGKVKLWFGGHAPASHFGPLVRRGYSGPEFGINYAERSLESFRASRDRTLRAAGST